MIEMFDEVVDGLPVLHAAPAGKQGQPLPTLFFYHGFTSSKEVYSYFGYAFAKAGFRVILPEANLHGSRFNGDEAYRMAHFWNILRSNIDELPAIYQHYQRQGLILDDRVGVCGASLGGMTTLGAKVRYPWIQAAASFMGSGYFESLSQTLFPPFDVKTVEDRQQLSAELGFLAEYDVSHRLEKLADKPLLIWHGLADDLVPAEESRRLIRDLAEQRLLEHIRFETEASIGHKITVSALDVGVQFFSRHL